jgi:hypothetical protein
MNPQQHYPGVQPPQAPQQNPYDFFLNPQQPARPPRFRLPIGNGSTLQQKALVGGGLAVILILLLVIVSAILGGGNKKQSAQLLTIAQQQTELIRVADLAKDQTAVRDSDTQVLSVNTGLSLSSAQNQLLPLIKTVKSPTDKKLSLRLNEQTDSKLTTAAQDNRYDEIFTSIINEQLVAYQASLKTAYNSSHSTKEKNILNSAYQGADLLLKEAKN